MLEKNKLQIGTCIVDKTKYHIFEGVIVKNDETTVNVLWFVISKFEYYSFEKKYMFKEIELFDYAIIPHFCKIKNLYSILSKYFENKIIYFLGISELERGSKTQFIYLKTSKNTFLEIIICYRNQNLYKNEEPIIWINEFNCITDLHLNESVGSKYYYFEEIKEIEIKELNTFLYGISLCDKNNRILLSISTEKYPYLNLSYINGMDTICDEYSGYKPHTKKDFINKFFS